MLLTITLDVAFVKTGKFGLHALRRLINCVIGGIVIFFDNQCYLEPVLNRDIDFAFVVIIVFDQYNRKLKLVENLGCNCVIVMIIFL